MEEYNMKKILLCLIAFTATGCVSTDDKKNGIAKNNVGYECKKVYATGSNIPKSFCSTKKQRDDLREKSKDEIRMMRTMHPTGNGEGGGVDTFGVGPGG